MDFESYKYIRDKKKSCMVKIVKYSFKGDQCI